MKILSDKTYKNLISLSAKTKKEIDEEVKAQVDEYETRESKRNTQTYRMEQQRTIMLLDRIKELTAKVDEQRDLITKLHLDIDILQGVE